MKLTKRILATVMSILMIMTSANIVTLAAEEPTITVSSVTGQNGTTVDVTVSISGNPGIVSVALDMTYDSSALTLTGVAADSVLPGAMHTNVYDSPYRLTWANDTAPSNYTDNGVLATLHFKVNEDAAAGDYPVEVSVPRFGIMNYDGSSLNFATVDGKVTVVEVHEHSLTHHSAVEATCNAEGNVEYWECSGCGLYFGDMNGSEEIDNVVIPKNSAKHTGGTEVRGAVAATETTNGYTGDTYCLGCGAKTKTGTVIPATGVEGYLKLAVSTDTVLPGETAVVYVNVEENPGVNYMQLTLDYDNTHMALLDDIIYGDFGEASVYGKNYSWSKSSGNYTNTGLLMELHFAVSEEELEASYPVTITMGDSGINNWDEEDIGLIVTDGAVEVILGVAGDMNGDEQINGKDVTRLLRHLNGEGIEIDLRAIDTNGDGKCNGKDTTRLLRVLNGENLALFYNGTAFYPNAAAASMLYASQTLLADAQDTGNEIKISLNKVEVEGAPANKITVAAEVTETSGVNYMQLVLDYDDEYLTLDTETIEYGTVYGEPSVYGNVFAWSKSSGNYTKTGTLMTMTFTVADGAPAGDYEIALKTGSSGINNWDEEDVALVTAPYIYTILPCQHTGDKTPVPAKDATCVAPGNVEYWICGDCGKYIDAANAVIADVTIPKNDANHVVKAADAALMHDTDAGKHYYVCECGNVYTGEYTTKLVNAVTETCGADGYSGDTYCTTCEGEAGLIAKGTVISATGAHTGGTATCVNQAVCGVCGQSYGDLAPDVHDDLQYVEAEAATCQATGNVAHWHCSGCDKNYSEEEAENEIADVVIAIDPDNHVGGDGGWSYDENDHWGTCVCGVSIDKTAHSGGTATCATQAVCEVCGQSYGDLAPEVHDDLQYVEAEAATCQETGNVAHWHCSGCDKNYSEEEAENEIADVVIAIDPDNHVGGDGNWNYDENDHWGTCACGEEIDKVAHAALDKWFTDADSHWHECECGKVMGEKEAHTISEEWEKDGNIRYKDCTVCGLILETKKVDDDGFSEIEAAMIALRNQKFVITATAGEGGSISDEGRNFVKFDRSMTFDITPDEGYEIESVLVNGKDVGAVEEYTFKNVRKNYTIVASFAEIEDEEDAPEVIDEAIVEESWENPFVDVADDADYIDAIEFVYENGLFKGISDTEFAPEVTMTRGMFVTVLGRLAGVDALYYAGTSFDDVVAGEWYAPYVEWAAEAGIVLGYGDGKFGVNDQITVEQAVVILARYAEYAGIYETADLSLEMFADAASVSEWALEAMTWAVENGIYTGEYGILAPQALAPRALIAEMLYSGVNAFELAD